MSVVTAQIPVGWLPFHVCVKLARKTCWMQCRDASGIAALCQQRGIIPSPAEAAGNSWMLSVPGAELLGLCRQGNSGCTRQFGTEGHPLLPKSLEPFKNHRCACHGLTNSGIFLSSLYKPK